MKTYSTSSPQNFFSMQNSVLSGQAPDGGLFMPERIPQLPSEQISNFKNCSFNEIAFQISREFFCPEISEMELSEIIHRAYNFEAPLQKVDKNLFFLELFHGPTLAFKDFGARFMAQLMSFYLQLTNQKLNILVATSGDTGGAVASAFHKVPNINVVILFPSQKVSKVQELQLTTWGDNIQALEIDGTFDDCQRFVKTAFLDLDFKNSCHLTSANSINISRLIPQSFYYFYAWSRLNMDDSCFIVPSGNLGNLSAGVIAKKMGLPIKQLVIATNSNQVIPEYFKSGEFIAKPSVSTLSNAMDVGNPSNLIRLQTIFNNNLGEIKNEISAYSFDDQQTISALLEVYQRYNYLICPHTAIGYLASKIIPSETPKVVLATAHPNKFVDVLERIFGFTLEPKPALEALTSRPAKSTFLQNDYMKIKSAIINLLC